MTAAVATKPASVQEPQRITVLSITVIASTEVREHNHATIKARMGNVPECVYESSGNGPIDALCQAFYGFEQGFKCIDWRAKALSEGSDAVGHIAVTIRTYDGKTYHGTGEHTNTLHATAIAIADALHKHFVHLHRYPRTTR